MLIFFVTALFFGLCLATLVEREWDDHKWADRIFGILLTVGYFGLLGYAFVRAIIQG